MRLKLFQTGFSALLFVLAASFQIQAQYRNKCPDYMWDIDYVPVTYLGFEKAPAAISYTGWGSNEVDGKFPLEVGLRNFSEKNIKAVKFHWYLFFLKTWQNSQAEDFAALREDVTLMRDEVTIDDTGEFKPKEDFEAAIKLPCEEIYEKVSNGTIKNELIMEFVLTEISYNDGTNWKRKQ
jgi:hypothetical protein